MKAFLCVLAALLVGLPVVGAARARSPEIPTWLMGDTWTYRVPTSKTATWRVLGITAEGYAVGIVTSDSMTVVHLTRGLAILGAHAPGDTWTNHLAGSERVAWGILGFTPAGYTVARDGRSAEPAVIDFTSDRALLGVYYFRPNGPSSSEESGRTLSGGAPVTV